MVVHLLVVVQKWEFGEKGAGMAHHSAVGDEDQQRG